jgi:hypothetical protein
MKRLLFTAALIGMTGFLAQPAFAGNGGGCKGKGCTCTGSCKDEKCTMKCCTGDKDDKSCKKGDKSCTKDCKKSTTSTTTTDDKK